MGVHGLWKLIDPSGKVVPLETLENKVLAVDLSIWLHQAIKGFRDGSGAPVPNAHLLAIYHRVCKLLYYKIKPIFIFDGGVPALKKNTIAKRNQLKAKNVGDVNKIQKKLLSTLLKHNAVNKVLSERTKSSLLGASSSKICADKSNSDDDLFKLPPMEMEECIESSSDEEESYTSSYSTEESTTDTSPTKNWDIYTIDVNSKEFKSLPADVRYEILSDLKETRKQSSWGRIHEMPTHSDDFSNYQMNRLRKRQLIQSSLEEAEKEMGGPSLSLGELETLLTDQGVITVKDSLSKRIAKDNTTRYVYIKDVKKAIEEAKLQEEMNKNKKLEDILEESNTEEKLKNDSSEQSTKKESELKEEDEDLELAIKLSLGQDVKLKEELNNKEETIKDEQNSQYDEDLALAIKLSLENEPSTSKQAEESEEKAKDIVNVNDDNDDEKEEINYLQSLIFSSSDDEESDGDNNEKEDREAGNSVLSSAKQYMVEYGGLTPAEVAKIIGNNAGNNKISSKPSKLSKLSKLINTKSADVVFESTKTLVRNEEPKKPILTASKAEAAKIEAPVFEDTMEEVEIMSDSDSSEEDLVEIEQQKMAKNERTLEVVIKPEEDMEDDIFADIFAAPNKSPVKDNEDKDNKEVKNPNKALVKENNDKELEKLNKTPVKDDKDKDEEVKKPITKKAVQFSDKVDVKIIDPINDLSVIEPTDQCKNIDDNQEDRDNAEEKSIELENKDKDEIDVEKNVNSQKEESLNELKEQTKQMEMNEELLKKPEEPQKAKKSTSYEDESNKLSTEELKKLQENLVEEGKELISERANKERLATNITDQMYQEAQELLELFGVPYIIAPMEAEAQCAFLEQINLTDGTITDDSDIWLFGGKTVYKNFFNQNKHVLEFRCENIEHHFKLTRFQLILLALLVGSDYTVGLPGIGPVTALEILATFPSKHKSTNATIKHDELLAGLKDFKSWFLKEKAALPARMALRNKLKNLSFNESFPSYQVVDAYISPTVDLSEEAFTWARPDIDALKYFAKQKFGWTNLKSEEILKPIIKRMQENRSQTSIKDYFKINSKLYSTDAEAKMSKRIQNAVRKMKGDGESDEDELKESQSQQKKGGRKPRTKRVHSEESSTASTSTSTAKKRGGKKKKSEELEIENSNTNNEPTISNKNPSQADDNTNKDVKAKRNYTRKAKNVEQNEEAIEKLVDSDEKPSNKEDVKEKRKYIRKAKNVENEQTEETTEMLDKPSTSKDTTQDKGAVKKSSALNSRKRIINTGPEKDLSVDDLLNKKSRLKQILKEPTAFTASRSRKKFPFYKNAEEENQKKLAPQLAKAVKFLNATKVASQRKVTQIETEVRRDVESAIAKVETKIAKPETVVNNIAKNLNQKEFIHQKEKEKSDMLKNKLKAIETFRKSKQGPGYVKKRNKVIRLPKEDAGLSESSDDD